MSFTKEKFDRLAEIKRQMNELKAEEEELKADVLAEMDQAGADKVDHDLGTFTVSGRKSWKFSDATEGIREQLKEKEKEEKADGTATFEESRFVVFKEKKI